MSVYEDRFFCFCFFRRAYDMYYTIGFRFVFLLPSPERFILLYFTINRFIVKRKYETPGYIIYNIPAGTHGTR